MKTASRLMPKSLHHLDRAVGMLYIPEYASSRQSIFSGTIVPKRWLFVGSRDKAMDVFTLDPQLMVVAEVAKAVDRSPRRTSR